MEKFQDENLIIQKEVQHLQEFHRVRMRCVTCSGHGEDDSFPGAFPKADASGDEALQRGVHGPVDLWTSRLLSDLQPQDVQHSGVQPADRAGI